MRKKKPGKSLIWDIVTGAHEDWVDNVHTYQTPKGHLKSRENLDDDEVWGTGHNELREQWKKERDDAQLESEAAKAYSLKKARERREKQKEELKKRGFNWPMGEGAFLTTDTGAPGRWHISPDGNVRRCTAANNCPFGTENHFKLMNGGVQSEANRVGRWIIEKREQQNNTKDSHKLDYSGVTPSDLALTGSMNAEERGSYANIIEVEATLPLVKGLGVGVTVSRLIGNTREMPWKDHAYWEIATTDRSLELRSDHIKNGDVDDFTAEFVEQVKDLDYEDKIELAQEVKSQILGFILAAESEATKGDSSSVHRSIVKVEETELFNSPNGASGRLNYDTMGLQPEMIERHLNATVGDFDNVRIASGFEVFDNSLGDGQAGWRMLKTPEGWEIELRGTRGDTALFGATNADLVEEGAREFFDARIKPEAAGRARRYSAEKPMNDFTREKAARVSFMRRLFEVPEKIEARIAERRAKFESKREDDSHRALYGVEPKAKKSTGFGRFMDLFE